MKTKKWLCLFMATAMTASCAVGFAGCDKKDDDEGKDPTPPPATWTDTNDYYLVGDGNGTLALSGWDQTKDEAELKFTKGAENTYTIEADLFEGEEFGIIYNFAWAGQRGYTNMNIANEGKDAQGNDVFVQGGGYDVKNMKVADGASGTYELKMKTYQLPSQLADFSWTLKEKIEIVTVTYYSEDGEDILGTKPMKKGATLDPMTVESDKLFYEFDGWYTEAEAGGTKYTAGAVNADLDLYAHFTEEENADYAADTNGWYLIGTVMGNGWTHSQQDLTMEKDASYTQHNVYTLEVELYTGDEFKITYGGNWNQPAFNIHDVQDADTTFGGTDNIKLIGKSGIYRITLVVNNNVAKIYWELLELIGSPYYLVGTYAAHPNWGDEKDGDWAIYLEETEAGSGIYTCEVTITEADIPTWWNQNPANEEAAALKIKNAKSGNDYGVGNGSGTAGNNNFWLTVGTWTITFDPATGTITYTLKTAE